MTSAADNRQAGAKQTLVDQLRKTPIVQVACERSGVSRATYYRWRKEDTEFAAETDAAIVDGALLVNDMAESQLISAIKDKSLGAIVFWLKNHHSTYSPRMQVNATHRLLDETLTPEQQAVVDQALKLSGMMEISDGTDDSPTD